MIPSYPSTTHGHMSLSAKPTSASAQTVGWSSPRCLAPSCRTLHRSRGLQREDTSTTVQSQHDPSTGRWTV
jgi:hypothetical protein